MNNSFLSLLAREELLEHARSDRYRGKLKDAISHEEHNPLCGDRVTVHVRHTDDGSIEEMKFEGDGCIVSQAAASMLAEYVQRKHFKEIGSMKKEDVEDLIGGSLSPSRVKCAMLGLVALKGAIKSVDNP